MKRIQVYGIGIVGNQKFCDQTRMALELLKEKAPFNFKQVQNFLKYIASYKYSCVTVLDKVFWVGKPTAFLDPNDYLFSLIWYASCIAHDAIHVEMFHRFKLEDPKETERYELFCCKLQAKCLKKLGASARHFAYLEESIKNRYWEGERTY